VVAVGESVVEAKIDEVAGGLGQARDLAGEAVFGAARAALGDWGLGGACLMGVEVEDFGGGIHGGETNFLVLIGANRR